MSPALKALAGLALFAFLASIAVNGFLNHALSDVFVGRLHQ